MKAIDLLRELKLGSLAKGSSFMKNKNFDVFSGILNPRSTYYYTFNKSEIVCSQPDVVLVCEGASVYLFKVER